MRGLMKWWSRRLRRRFRSEGPILELIGDLGVSPKRTPQRVENHCLHSKQKNLLRVPSCLRGKKTSGEGLRSPRQIPRSKDKILPRRHEDTKEHEEEITNCLFSFFN